MKWLVISIFALALFVLPATARAQSISQGDGNSPRVEECSSPSQGGCIEPNGSYRRQEDSEQGRRETQPYREDRYYVRRGNVNQDPSTPGPRLRRAR